MPGAAVSAFDHALPVIFLGLMGFAMLLYVVLDGFDLGVGMWLRGASTGEKDTMIASIGPFWDANETWLVLGVGILLIAFPRAHGLILGALYLPVAAMLIGLIMRGVAFDFRVKARDDHKPLWNTVFFAGSTLTALAQGWMLGRYITGLEDGALALGFAALIAAALPTAYLLLGATWLVMKTEGELQLKAVRWARAVFVPVVVGIGAISLATPLVSATVRQRWFALPEFIGLAPIPLATTAALAAIWVLLREAPRVTGPWCWVPFALTVLVFVLAGLGLAYSLYPFVLIDRLTVWDAASSPAALKVILIGVCISVPAILGYTVLAYRVFRGKAAALTYA
jgi:cytochrome bd ubiquinol oxidase subunit II